MKLIAGLGNPGKEFVNTYHNLGFEVIDKLATKLGVSINKAKGNALYTQTKINDEIVFLIKPLTYMNLSGQAIKHFVSFYKIAPQDIIVVCDDIDLEKGVARFRERGSGGTHNGLKNIVFELKTEDFKRIKIGASRNQNEKHIDLKDYVLGQIDKESRSLIEPSFDIAIEKILDTIKRPNQEIKQ